MDTYLTSDTHFGHIRIAEFCPRRKELGDTVEARDENLILRWNSTIRPIDRVFCLGDVTFHRDYQANKNIFDRLNGTIHLIPGNHDALLLNDRVLMRRFELLPPLEYRKFGTNSAVLCHYPMLEWQNGFHGTYMLHGHSHGQHPESKWRRMDVGIDAHPEMRPWSLGEIRAKLESKPSQDHSLYEEKPHENQ